MYVGMPKLASACCKNAAIHEGTGRQIWNRMQKPPVAIQLLHIRPLTAMRKHDGPMTATQSNIATAIVENKQ